MEALPVWVNASLAIVGALGALVTAIATFFLWRVTKTLAHETTRMVEAAAQPHIVVTITPNHWSLNHFDIHVDNTGNATAYDIKVSFDPPLENGETRGAHLAIPFQNISVLKPGQGMASHLSGYESLKNKNYRITISWKRDSTKNEYQTNRYTLRMNDYTGISQLGNEPLIEIAKCIKAIEENWKPIAKGQRRTEVDVFSSFDRPHEIRQKNRQRRRWKIEVDAERAHASRQESNSSA
ncbi:hypothetical protein WJ974_07885 [Achromobacter xylosoxidans]